VSAFAGTEGAEGSGRLRNRRSLRLSRRLPRAREQPAQAEHQPASDLPGWGLLTNSTGRADQPGFRRVPSEGPSPESRRRRRLSRRLLGPRVGSLLRLSDSLFLRDRACPSKGIGCPSSRVSDGRPRAGKREGVTQRMAWERRKRGGLYYTRSRREGGRVVREYRGCGSSALLAAALDEERREERRAERGAVRLEREGCEEVRLALQSHRDALERLTVAALEAAGYHEHKGEWRRRRRA
jgi:hypothetical protein